MAEEKKTQLLDLLSASGSDDIEPTKAAAARQALYPEVSFIVRPVFIGMIYNLCQYLPMSTLIAGVKAGQLHQGHFNANQYNYLEVSIHLLEFSFPEFHG